MSANTDPKQELLISVPQEALIRRWPRLWQSFSEDVTRQKRRHRVRKNIGLAAIVGLAVFAAFAGVERYYTESRHNREQDAQQAQQNTDLATNLQSALENQLKKEEEKLQLAQQEADLAASRRSALETELKKAQEVIAELAQPNTDVATSQRSELETQQKKAEEQLQLAQQNADLANSQRSALETELKKAQEEKAQLAQQNTDVAISQRSELETQLKKAEEQLQLAQQNTDLANSQRSALETQLKKAQEEKAQLAQQNTDLASQRSALETQQKNEQLKLQQVQANADHVASQSSEFQAQLTQEQEKAQKDRLNPPQDVSPTPSPPSSKESETANPPESQFNRNAEASGEKELLKEFVLGYLRTVASNETSTQRRYFAERVNFYGRGVLDLSNVEASTQRYHDEWPIRQWAPRGKAKVVRSRNPNLFVVYQPFSWTVSHGSKHAHGNATLYLRIRKNSQGEFRIVHVKQLGR